MMHVYPEWAYDPHEFECPISGGVPERFRKNLRHRQRRLRKKLEKEENNRAIVTDANGQILLWSGRVVLRTERVARSSPRKGKRSAHLVRGIQLAFNIF